jgi:hypothetical protein
MDPATPPPTSLPGLEATDQPPSRPGLAELLDDAATEGATWTPDLWVWASGQPAGTVAREPLQTLWERLAPWRPPHGEPPLELLLRARNTAGRWGRSYTVTLQAAAKPAVDPAVSELRHALEQAERRAAAAEAAAAASRPLEGRSVSSADPFETSAKTLKLAEDIAAKMHPPRTDAALTPESIAAAVRAGLAGVVPPAAAEAPVDPAAAAVVSKGLEVADRLMDRLFARWDRRDATAAEVARAEAQVAAMRAAAAAAAAAPPRTTVNAPSLTVVHPPIDEEGTG